MRRLVTSAMLLAVFVCAARADAREVTLWACGGPAGRAPAFSPFVMAGTVSCAAPLGFGVPAGTTLKHVRLDRRAQGPGYVTRAADVLERVDDASVLDGVATFATGGDSVSLSGGTIDLRSLALVVSDTTLPNGAVGGLRNPAVGVLNLDVQASDSFGLARVTA